MTKKNQKLNLRYFEQFYVESKHAKIKAIFSISIFTCNANYLKIF